ncbi:MAG: S-layer homology domain-containing protein [Firmicutes bacterium]|nr:S-layer homology domain-containing protein [Bacillota bacterium]
MKRYRQRFLTWWLTTLLLLTLIPAGALADDKPAVSLEQAIRTVKDNFEIPKEYTRFTSGYNNYDNRQVWSLDWNKPGEPGGSFHAQVDAITGEITNVNYWDAKYQPEPGLRLPTISKAEAQEIAAKLLARLAPNRVAELQLVTDDDQVMPLNNYGPVTYNFIWQRVVNGAVFPGNGVYIGVRGDDGRVINYNLNWTKSALPATAGAISPEKAREAFEKAGMLELQYFMSPPYKPLAAGEKPRVQLVYQLHHPSNGVIDALTGEPVILDSGSWLLNGGGGDGGAQEMARKALASQAPLSPLSPEELQEIEKTAKLISQDEAVAAVKKWVDIPADLVLRNANLMTAWQSPETRIWHLYWNAKNPGPGKPDYISARVNALTGELLGFDLSSPYPGPEKAGKLSREAAQKMVENFLRQVQPQRFQEVKLEENNPGGGPRPLKESQNPPVQYFIYQRVVNGIVFPGNTISVTVDTVAGRIISYNLNWFDLDFPAPEKLLNANEATEAFLKNRPLTLSYNQVYGPAGPEKVQLVYQPLAAPGKEVTNLIDAKTGEPLDWQGKPLAQQPRAHRFTDIQGSFGEQEITLLGQAGIFGEYGDTFRPAENITAASLLRAMLMANNGPWGIIDLSDEDVLKQARERGWLKEDLLPNATISREMLAKMVIRLLNLERAARVQGIYQVPYADTNAIAKDSFGYVALAWGLDILKGDGSYFRPDQAVTRAEAAVALVRAMKVRP